MKRRAQPPTVVSYGGGVNSKGKLPGEAAEQPCGCYDGEGGGP